MVFVIIVDDDMMDVDNTHPAVVKDDINIDSASIEDAFLLVPMVEVEENVDDRPCKESR